jgi:hypothetical protein
VSSAKAPDAKTPPARASLENKSIECLFFEEGKYVWRSVGFTTERVPHLECIDEAGALIAHVSGEDTYFVLGSKLSKNEAVKKILASPAIAEGADKFSIRLRFYDRDSKVVTEEPYYFDRDMFFGAKSVILKQITTTVLLAAAGLLVIDTVCGLLKGSLSFLIVGGVFPLSGGTLLVGLLVGLLLLLVYVVLNRLYQYLFIEKRSFL